MKFARLSALHIGILYHPGGISSAHFCWRLSWHCALVRQKGSSQRKIGILTPILRLVA